LPGRLDRRSGLTVPSRSGAFPIRSGGCRRSLRLRRPPSRQSCGRRRTWLGLRRPGGLLWLRGTRLRGRGGRTLRRLAGSGRRRTSSAIPAGRLIGRVHRRSPDFMPDGPPFAEVPTPSGRAGCGRAAPNSARMFTNFLLRCPSFVATHPRRFKSNVAETWSATAALPPLFQTRPATQRDGRSARRWFHQTRTSSTIRH
jgi:hypothetical protein